MVQNLPLYNMCRYDFNTTLKQLSKDFGKYVQEKKYGFCFADNYGDNDIMIDLPVSAAGRRA